MVNIEHPRKQFCFMVDYGSRLRAGEERSNAASRHAVLLAQERTGMKRDHIRSQLDRAMEDVRRGAALVAEQRLLIERLQTQGQNLAEANRILATFEAMQATNVAHRDMLYRQLMVDSEVY